MDTSIFFVLVNRSISIHKVCFFYIVDHLGSKSGTKWPSLPYSLIGRLKYPSGRSLAISRPLPRPWSDLKLLPPRWGARLGSALHTGHCASLFLIPVVRYGARKARFLLFAHLLNIRFPQFFLRGCLVLPIR